MCGPNQQPTFKEKEKQEQTITLELNRQRREEERPRMQGYLVDQEHKNMEEQMLGYRAELYEMGRVPDMQLVVRRREQPSAPPASKLTDRQRRKMANKRANNLKKAQKQKIPYATADTLPMMQAVQSYYQEARKNPINVNEAPRLDANLFTPNFPEEMLCSIDVKKAMHTLDLLRARSARWYDENNLRREMSPSSSDEIADYLLDMRNETYIPVLENVLKRVLQANGVDLATGQPVGAAGDADDPIEESEEYTQALREEAGREIQIYRDTVLNKEISVGREAEMLFQEELNQLRVAHRMESTGGLAPEETRDLDFVFHYKELEQEYLRLRRTIEENPEGYALHKESIDRRYQIYMDAQKEIADYGERIFALTQRAQMMTQGKVSNYLREQASALVQCAELDHLQSIATQQLMAIRFLVADKPFPEEMAYMYRVMEEEEGIYTTEREQQKEEYLRFQELDADQKVVMRKSDAKHQRIAFHAVDEIQRRHKAVKAVERKNYYKWADMDHRPKEERKDLRAMMCLVHGAQLNANGEPLDAEQEQYLREDEKMMDAYLSGDVERVRPYLDKAVQDVLDFPYWTVDVEKELAERPAELMHALDINCYIQNMRANYPAYFEALPQERKDRIFDMMTLGAAFTSLLLAFAGSIGVELNEGRIYDSTLGTTLFRDSIPERQAEFERLKSSIPQTYGE